MRVDLSEGELLLLTEALIPEIQKGLDKGAVPLYNKLMDILEPEETASL